MIKIEVIIPEKSGDFISESLRKLTELILIKGLADDLGSGLGGEYGYGANYENGIFKMHRFCWCENDGCPWCYAPNFLFKPTGLKIWWYKWIGRYMESNKKCSEQEWKDIFDKCIESIGGEVKG